MLQEAIVVIPRKAWHDKIEVRYLLGDQRTDGPLNRKNNRPPRKEAQPTASETGEKPVLGMKRESAVVPIPTDTLVFYFIANSFEGSGVETLGEQLRHSAVGDLILVKQNHLLGEGDGAIDDGVIKVPIHESHRTPAICRKLLSQAYRCNARNIWIIPNNSETGFEIYCLLSRYVQRNKRCGDAYTVRLATWIHSEVESSYVSTACYAPYISLGIGVTETIARKLVRISADRFPVAVIRYPNSTLPECNLLQAKIERGKTSPREIRICYAGRLVENQKRVSRLKTFVKKLVNLHIEFSFEIFGDGEQRRTLEKDLRQFHCTTHSICFHGLVDRETFLERLATFDIIVLTSDFEGDPLVIREAMSLGVVPVVMDYGRGTAETVEDGVTGTVVEQGDANKLAEKVAWLANNQNHIARLSDNCLKKSRQWFRPDQVLRQLYDLLANSPQRRTGTSITRRTTFTVQKLHALAQTVKESNESMRGVAIFGLGTIGRKLIDSLQRYQIYIPIRVAVDGRLSKLMSSYSGIRITNLDDNELGIIQVYIITSIYFKDEMLLSLRRKFGNNSLGRRAIDLNCEITNL